MNTLNLDVVIPELKTEGRTKDEILTDLVILFKLSVSKANTYYTKHLKALRPEVSFATTFDNYLIASPVLDTECKAFIEDNAEPSSVANKLKSLGYFKSRANLAMDIRIAVRNEYKAKALNNLVRLVSIGKASSLK